MKEYYKDYVIGDTVIVTNRAYTYSSHRAAFKRLGFTNIHGFDNSPTLSGEYVVFGLESHDFWTSYGDGHPDIMVAIRYKGSVLCEALVGYRGLELVSKGAEISIEELNNL